MYVDVDEEDLDDDFFQEIDAAEAAAAHPRVETRDPSSDVTDNSTSGDVFSNSEKSAANINTAVPSVPRTPAQSAPAAAVPKSPPGNACCRARRTSEPGSRMPDDVDRFSQDCTAPAAQSLPIGGFEPAYEHRWEVKTISVRDGSAVAVEDVGKVSRIQGTSRADTYSSRLYMITYTSYIFRALSADRIITA